MELQTGKRLQPYYDRADRPRIDAWQTLVNHYYGLHDPNAPENRRTLTLPDNLPETKQAIAEGVTRGIDALYHAGEIKGRQDVIQALTEAGIDVVRVTRSSISIADPNGGKNIRLKGAFYEQSFTDGCGVREKAERESRIYRENAERRVQEARRICKQGTDLKRIFNQERYQRPYISPERTSGEVSENDRRYDGRTLENRTENERETLAVADYRLSTDVCHDREPAVVPGHEDKREHEYSPRVERESGEAEREDMGRALSRGQQRTFSGVARGDESRNELDDGKRETECRKAGTGVTEHDGAGKTFAERIRTTATGLYAAAERMGERLRGIAENVFAYATGQRDAERAGHAVESAGAALERADRTLEPVIQREQEIRDERLIQECEHALSLEREHQLEIQERTLDGPSLGW
ncbi:plasmid mobilization relaxase MbeA [Shigella flexneri]|uniref:plasmid mobilization relaxase MbeA n=1 Tax=Enterobacteriaceae TaxID=543 RepID=UPI003CCA7852